MTKCACVAKAQAHFFKKNNAMNYDYLISTYHWRFTSDYPLVDTLESGQFRMEPSTGQPHWSCRITEAEALPSAEGELISQTEERRLYLDGELLWQELLNRKDGQPIFCAAYPAAGDAEVRLWSLTSQYPYTARMEHIWSAVDFPYQLLQRDILTVHSACIETDGQAILFLAPSGTGKSTQAKLWHDFRGARQLNGDKTGLAWCRETVTAYGLPFCGTSAICEDFQLPVRAMVLLSQAQENSIHQLVGVSALKAVLENCFGHCMVPGCTERLVAIASKMLQKIPVYSLACTPDERAVMILEDELRKER